MHLPPPSAPLPIIIGNAKNAAGGGRGDTVLKTSNNQVVYWLTGFAFMWCLLPAKLIDMAMAPAWFAPNPECTSSEMLDEALNGLLLPWTVLVALISAAVAFVLIRGRQSGAPVFKIDLGKPSKNIGVTLVMLVVVVPLLFDVVRYLWQIMVPQTVSSDCTGSADLVSAVMRRPALQVSPFVELTVAFWLLHIRALLLSKRVA